MMNKLKGKEHELRATYMSEEMSWTLLKTKMSQTLAEKR